MTTTSTYKELWATYGTLSEQLNTLLEDAIKNGVSVLKSVDIVELESLNEELADLLAASEDLPSRADREALQCATNILTWAVERTIADARLLKCDPKADPDRLILTWAAEKSIADAKLLKCDPKADPDRLVSSATSKNPDAEDIEPSEPTSLRPYQY